MLDHDMDSLLLIAKFLKRVPCLAPIALRYNQFRHAYIAKQIRSICMEAEKCTQSQKPTLRSNNGPIWVFWWQGLDHAPDVVRFCISSIQHNAPNRKIVVITRDNVKEYAQISDTIYTKLSHGNITLTHFSDILRFNLLKNYGGLWMDATLYVVRPLSRTIYFEPFYTCSGYPDPTFFNISRGRWTGFFIGGNEQEPLFSYMDTFFNLYWSQNDTLIDYFLIDYALDHAFSRNIGSLRTWCLATAHKYNPSLFDLAPLLPKPFDSDKWYELTQYTDIFKLSWKKTKSYPPKSFGDLLLIQKENSKGIK